MITKIATPNREEWKNLRHKYIGGSDAAAVVGLNPFSSAYSLWAEKTDRVPPFEGNLATEVGTYLEDFVAKKFEEETGKKVRRENHSILNDEYPWAIANVDRVVVGEDAGLEIKTTSELNMKSFKNGEYPSNYYAQCVHYLALTGKSRWYLAALIGNKEFKWFTIERDQDEIDALMAAEENFWKCVTDGVPPEADGSKATTDAIKTIYTTSNNDQVSLFSFDDCLKQYIELGKQVKELQSLQNEMANKVKVFMGAAGKGESDHYNVSWSTVVKKGYYVNESTSRQFRVTAKN